MKTVIMRISILLMLLLCIGSGIRYFVNAETIKQTSLNDVVAMPNVSCSAQGMDMLDLDSNRIIMAMIPHKRLPIASTT